MFSFSKHKHSNTRSLLFQRDRLFTNGLIWIHPLSLYWCHVKTLSTVQNITPHQSIFSTNMAPKHGREYRDERQARRSHNGRPPRAPASMHRSRSPMRRAEREDQYTYREARANNNTTRFDRLDSGVGILQMYTVSPSNYINSHSRLLLLPRDASKERSTTTAVSQRVDQHTRLLTYSSTRCPTITASFN